MTGTALALLLGGTSAVTSAPTPAIRPNAIIALHRFVQCTAVRQPGATARVLALPFESAELDAEFERSRKNASPCLFPGQRIVFSRMLYAGALAEQVVERRFRDDAALATAVAYDPARPPIKAQSDVGVLGMCVVRAQPAATRTLFATEPASAAEKRAIGMIVPAVAPCTPAGAKIRLNPAGLRALLAIGAYRLTTPATASGVAG